MPSDKGYLDHLSNIAAEDVQGLLAAEAQYGDSWKKRGGAGAYMIMVRKFDRLEQAMPKFNYDIFLAVEEDPRAEGVIDDIRDARRYLYLIEAEIRARGINPQHRDNASKMTVTVPCEKPENLEFVPARPARVDLSDPADGRSFVKPKYRDPDTGITWSGRGQMPVWMRAKVDEGASKEDFLIQDSEEPVVIEPQVTYEDVEITITTSDLAEVLEYEPDSTVSSPEPVETEVHVSELEGNEENRD
jgi:hypothetical protein